MTDGCWGWAGGVTDQSVGLYYWSLRNHLLSACHQPPATTLNLLGKNTFFPDDCWLAGGHRLASGPVWLGPYSLGLILSPWLLYIWKWLRSWCHMAGGHMLAYFAPPPPVLHVKQPHWADTCRLQWERVMAERKRNVMWRYFTALNENTANWDVWRKAICYCGRTPVYTNTWKTVEKRLLQSANDKQSKRKIPQTHPDPSTETEGTGTVLLERQRISSYSDKAMFL